MRLDIDDFELKYLLNLLKRKQMACEAILRKEDYYKQRGMQSKVDRARLTLDIVNGLLRKLAQLKPASEVEQEQAQEGKRFYEVIYQCRICKEVSRVLFLSEDDFRKNWSNLTCACGSDQLKIIKRGWCQP